MLRIPQAILNAMPKGPLAGDARAIETLLPDPARAALVIVTLAEDLPAREARSWRRRRAGRWAMPLGPLIVNAVPTDALSAPAVDAVMAAAGPVRAATRMTAADRCARRCEWPRASAPTGRRPTRCPRWLKRDLGLPMITLPRIPTAEIGPRSSRS